VLCNTDSGGAPNDADVKTHGTVRRRGLCAVVSKSLFFVSEFAGNVTGYYCVRRHSDYKLYKRFIRNAFVQHILFSRLFIYKV